MCSGRPGKHDQAVPGRVPQAVIRGPAAAPRLNYTPRTPGCQEVMEENAREACFPGPGAPRPLPGDVRHPAVCVY